MKRKGKGTNTLPEICSPTQTKPNQPHLRSLIPRLVGRPATGPASTAGSISEPAAEPGASELLGLSEESLEQRDVFEEEEPGEKSLPAPSPSDIL